ncbi:TorF family putative porin [Acinetobacter sp. KS-LM10]|uniref:TorF family putative porin n=1 Tax=Acinetobacter sp. KS-LM10 TaxID=3120518 RepID=UPI0030CF76A1
MQFSLQKSWLALVISVLTTSVFAQVQNEDSSQGKISGNFGAVTKYIYRGGVENDDITFQAGLKYEHKSGVYLNYWGSTLDYDSTDINKDHGFEHDFGIGYTKEINEALTYRTQVTAFVYHNGGSSYNDDRSERRRSTGTEWLNTLNYRNLSLNLGIALSDANYGNAGDMYLGAGYSHPLFYDILLNTSIVASIYNDHRDNSLVQTEKNFLFNETRVGLSMPLVDSGVVIGLDYIWGIKDRLNQDLDEHLVFAVNYSF